MSEPLPRLDDVIRWTVKDRLNQFAGNKAVAAESLGITLKTLYNWIRRWSGPSIPDREYWADQVRPYVSRQ